MLLSLMLFFPLLAALILLFIPANKSLLIKSIALTGASGSFLLSIVLLSQFKIGPTSFQLVVNYPWIPSLGISYLLGVDGLSLALVLLTTLMGLITFLYSWKKTEEVKPYFILLLILLTGMLGVFLSLNLFLFYLFFEISLVPMYFLIGLFGGEKRKYAAIKFFLYTLLGSLAILLGLLILYFQTDSPTFSFLEMSQTVKDINPDLALLAFLALFFGFAIKLPVFPVHTWLPLAHVEAPTAGSVLLAAILLKMGGYGFLRFLFPFFPVIGAKYASLIALLALISLIYGSLVALAQTDLKKMIAYSSIGHMAYLLFGLAAAFSYKLKEGAVDYKITALNGASLQMLAHGIITGGLFLLVGLLYKRLHTRQLTEMGGLLTRLPVFGGLFIFFCFASLGLPALAGFVAEFLTLLGAFPFFPIKVGLALIGIILTATYFLKAIQKVLFGELPPRFANVQDLTKGEIALFIPLVLLIILIGIYPAPLLKLLESSNFIGLFR